MISRTCTRALLATTAMLAVLSTPAFAETVTELPPLVIRATPPGTPGIGGRSAGTDELPHTKAQPDAAAMLGQLLGIDTQVAGPISGLPVVRGLAGDRLAVAVNGVAVTAACPNHMNPPTLYVSPAQTGGVSLWTGATPVSLGGDNIGGTITIEDPAPVFADTADALHTEGLVSAYVRSVNTGVGSAARATMATDRVSVTAHGAVNRARNYRDGHGARVRSTEFENASYGASLSARLDDGVVTLKAGQNLVPEQGFVNQPMDLTDNTATYVNLGYEGETALGALEARLYWQGVRHEMNFLADKDTFYTSGMYAGTTLMQNGGMPMNSKASDFGYAVKLEHPLADGHTLRLGNEFHGYRLDDWWPPSFSMMGPNTFVNINDGERLRIGTFAEWEADWSPEWTTLLGIRNDTVFSDAGRVQGYENTDVQGMGMMGAQVNYLSESTAFNNRDRSRTDVNVDLSALARYSPSAGVSLDGGYARKSRSPNLYERYSWSTGTMASSMIGWSGDANGYVGDPDLKPEVAHTLSVSLTLEDAAAEDWMLKVTPYATYVEDYIDVDRLGPLGMDPDRSLLRFANHDARMFGVEINGRKRLYQDDALGLFTAKGRLAWIDGERTDGNNLYQMMPLNLAAEIEHRLGGWTGAIGARLVADKDDVQGLRHEIATPGHAVFNLRAGYEIGQLRIDAGIDNLLDHRTLEPLGGRDYADWNATGATTLGAVPGPGRSFNLALTWSF